MGFIVVVGVFVVIARVWRIVGKDLQWNVKRGFPIVGDG